MFLLQMTEFQIDWTKNVFLFFYLQIFFGQLILPLAYAFQNFPSKTISSLLHLIDGLITHTQMLRGKKPCNFQNPSAFLSWLSKTFSRQNTKKNRPQVGTHKVNGSFSAIAVSFLCEINDQPGAIVCSFHGFLLNFIEWKPKNLKQSSILASKKSIFIRNDLTSLEIASKIFKWQTRKSEEKKKWASDRTRAFIWLHCHLRTVFPSSHHPNELFYY